MTQTHIVIATCRTGFEKEVAAELTDVATSQAIAGYAKTNPGSGMVQFVCQTATDASQLTKPPFTGRIFIRHWFTALPLLTDLPLQDRVTPLAQNLAHLPAVRAVEPVIVDTNEGKSLAKLTQGLCRHLSRGLVPRDGVSDIGQLLMTTGDSAFLGVVSPRHTSRWAQGIPRLRVPREAPSRATLKLEEAWHHFVPKAQWEERLAPGMTAVDLGAAPGGWTWQLVKRSMFVHAVDNGPMDSTLMDSGQVEHHWVDGYGFEPAKPVDWLVVDIADKPARTTGMIIHWATQRWFGEAIFNLKLPMKQRYASVREYERRMITALEAQDIRFSLRFKQLYHDREEVTGHLRLLN